MKTGADDPMYDMLEEEARDLMERQRSLEAKKEKLGMVDSPEEIANCTACWGILRRYGLRLI